PHVLGIDRRHGGCGGKSTYSAVGVIAAYEVLERRGALREPSVLLIGSAGAMGRVVLDRLLEGDPGRVAVCDLRYERAEASPLAGRVVTAVVGHWTDRLVGASDRGCGPYEAMLDACDPQLAVAG